MALVVGIMAILEPLHPLHTKQWIIFLSSEILRSTSPVQAFNLARLKTETYVDLQEQKEKNGKSDFLTAVQAIFKDGTPKQTSLPGTLA